MLKAYALYYAVLVSLIISLISGSVIMLGYYSRLETDGYQIQSKLLLNAHSGVNLLLSESYAKKFELGERMRLFNSGIDSVFLKTGHWGLFQVLVSQAYQGRYRRAKVALAGALDTVMSSSVLYLSDNNRALFLAGNTKITGDVFLPRAGVERAYISRKYFQGTQLVNGKIKLSQTRIPGIDAHLVQYLTDLLQEPVKENEKTKGLRDMNNAVINSFVDPTVHFTAQEDISLDKVELRGNVKISSRSSIIVGNTAKLQDVILIAPRIIIRSGFKGSCNLVASEYINLEDNVELQYPSSVSLVSDSKGERVAQAMLGKDTKLTGSVFLATQSAYAKPVRMVIGKGGEVFGNLVVLGQMELNGAVHGSLACDALYLETSSSTYLNHLLDAVIDRSGVPDYFLGGLVLQGRQKKGIVKWLN